MPNAKLVIDRRSKLVSQGKTGEDPIVDKILSGEIPQSLLDEVAGIKADKVQKYYLEASLLTDADLESIAEYFELDVDVVSLYAYLYYDVRDLKRLQKISVIAKERDPDIKQIKAWAISQGFSFIQWRTGGSVRISPVEGLVSLYADCFYKSKEAFFNSNSTDASKEAAKWCKQSTDVARLLKIWTTDSDEARKDIELAIKKIQGDDISFPDIDELGIDLTPKDEE